MQPLRPQVHRAPPIFTTMWPISAAAPRPSHGLPSRTRPPPTPVPQKTPIRLWNSRPSPSWNSASVATWTSLLIQTSVPSASFRALASGKLPSQPGRFLAEETTPVFSSASPGEPTPIPASAAVSTPASFAASRRAPAIASATSSGPPLVGVGRRACPTTSLPASTIAVWILVPPRSMPPRKSATPASLRADERLEAVVGEAALVRAQPPPAAALADRSPCGAGRLLHPPSGRGGGAGGARGGTVEDRRGDPARA